MKTNDDTSALKRELDELVSALYGLTPEEKAPVQAGAKLIRWKQSWTRTF